ncbi:uncharacterized protein HMPREF1541_02743 [Cyphellophora europaea CBS 101466]|uniref:DUF7730 domain-containing protein n=1 Tax=Cyphellophora europaea (strain CBS 101466) TaxID=1220924 RepID=W2S6M6_CYPE1|nr:uncharacterized protein HMPREF1541_02743 [Cyphellophora europaea CBS 101466]ETN43584.1 hypothetical protein HMPREF1541_02743 [Cyphellophora europaea CBS 101466]
MMELSPQQRGAVEPNELLWLPAEVRLRIYGYLLMADPPLCFVISERGSLFRLNSAYSALLFAPRFSRFTLSSKGELPQQTTAALGIWVFAQTCRFFHAEAMTYFYTHNTFDFYWLTLQNLPALQRSQPASSLIRVMAMQYQFDILNITKSPQLWHLDPALPWLQHLTLTFPGLLLQFLVAVLDLTRHLPCNDLRTDWPTLRLHIDVPRNKSAKTLYRKEMLYGRGNDELFEDAFVSDRQTFHDDYGRDIVEAPWQAKPNVHLKRMLGPYLPPYESAAGLGRELPGVRNIVMEGCMVEELLYLVENHQTDGGRCQFVHVGKKQHFIKHMQQVESDIAPKEEIEDAIFETQI